MDLTWIIWALGAALLVAWFFVMFIFLLAHFVGLIHGVSEETMDWEDADNSLFGRMTVRVYDLAREYSYKKNHPDPEGEN